jgi:hypothetical protein
MKSLNQIFATYLESHPRLKKAQAFVELALILPILLMILLGVVELSFMTSQYLDLLDLTREAARFASVRDPFDPVAADFNCTTENLFDFYYDTSCIFSPPAGSANCIYSTYCNGVNQFITLDPATDDVVVSVFTVSDKDGTYAVKEAWPAPDGYWALSDHDLDTVNNDNWTRDCQGTVIRTEPYYTIASVTSRLNSSPTATMTHNKGFVAIEFYYCYHHVLHLPVWTMLVSDPLRLHAYTLMSLPAAAPTPTPIPTKTATP